MKRTPRLLASLKLNTARLGNVIKQDLVALTPLRIIEGVILLFIAMQISILAVNELNKDSPILGLRLESHVVGRLNQKDFKNQVNAIINDYENKSIEVRVADVTSAVTLRQLGVDADEQQIYETLLATGRTGNILTRFADQNMAVLGGRNITLGQPHFNSEVAKQHIAAFDQKIDISPTNAHFAYENEKVVVRADSQGRIVDADAAMQMLSHINPTLHTQVTLPIKQTTATITTKILEPLLSQVQAIAQKPLTIMAAESQVTLTPEQLVALVVPKVSPDPNDANKMVAQISFDESKLNAAIDEVLKQAVIAPQPTIMNGDQVVKQGANGLQTEDTHSLVHVLTALIQRQTGASTPDTAQIPLVTVTPPVVQQVVNNPATRTGTGLVRLTFDDGPGAYTEQVLDILKRYNVHGTFYVIGRNVQRYPDTMQRIKNEGHTIGNHSFSHANLNQLSRDGVHQELASTQQAIQAACGITPTAFRPPYGLQNQTVREVAASMGMSVDLWSVDTRDWATPGSNVITQRALAGTGPGAVVLLHVLNQQSVNALPSIIEGVRAQGFSLE